MAAEARRRDERDRRPAGARAPGGAQALTDLDAAKPHRAGIHHPGRPAERREIHATEPGRGHHTRRGRQQAADDPQPDRRHPEPAGRAAGVRGHAGNPPRQDAAQRAARATARQALGEGDVSVLVVDAAAGITAARSRGGRGGREAAGGLVAANKTDLVPRANLLAVCAAAQRSCRGRDRAGERPDRRQRRAPAGLITERLPESPTLYPPDQVTEQSERFLAAEIVREKMVAQTRDEIPYTTAVIIEAFREEPDRDLVVIRRASSSSGEPEGDRDRRTRAAHQGDR